MLETKGSPSVRDRELLVKTSNILHISLQTNVWISQNSDQDRQLFQLSPEHCSCCYFRWCKKWVTAEPVLCMKPIFQITSADHRQIRILSEWKQFINCMSLWWIENISWSSVWDSTHVCVVTVLKIRTICHAWDLWKLDRLHSLRLPDLWNLTRTALFSVLVTKRPESFEMHWIKQYLVNVVLFGIKDVWTSIKLKSIYKAQK